MFNNKFVLVSFIFLVAFLFSCKKYDTLPELDALGNNMNPKSGTEYVSLDSSRIYNIGIGKYVKSYVSIDATSIQNMGFTWSQVKIYKNGVIFSVYNSPTINKNFIINVVSGQVLNFEFSVVDINGRESKKSKIHKVIIP
jgi:hypothetical protein